MSEPFTKEEVKAALQKLSHGRARACKKLPYMTDAIYALIPWAAELPHGIGMGVRHDGVLFYNPKVVNDEWDTDDVVTGLIHEAEHVLRKHARRREKRSVPKSEYTIWNYAADAELGDDLEAMQCKMLPSDITPKKLGLANGQLAEVYFEQIKKLAPPGKRKCCGSGAGVPFPDEDKMGGPQLVEAEREVQLENVRESVATAIKTHGNVPQQLKRWAEQELAAKTQDIPWEQKLQALARRGVAWKKGYTDATFSRLNRRQASVGFGPGRPIIPASVAPVPLVALCQDTSLSMSKPEISKTWQHAGKILSCCGGRLIWVSIDAAVHSIGAVSNVSQMKARTIGGGGTDFRPAFRQLKEMKNRPDIVVYFTDGYGDYPRPEEVLWCKTIWLHVSHYHGTVPFGTVIPVY